MRRSTIYTPFRALVVAATAATLTVGCGSDETARGLETLSYDTVSTPKSAATASKPGRLTPGEQLAAAAASIEPLLQRQTRRSLTSREKRAMARSTQELERAQTAIGRQFAADHKKLSELGADDAVERLEAIQRSTREQRSAWAAAVGQLPTGDKDPQAARAARKALRALAPAPESQPRSSGAFGSTEPKPAEPVLSAGVTPAYSSPLPNASGSTLPREPEAADLETTPETKVTGAISSLAQELGGDPVKIYEYVRNTIAYEPYFGIRKGAAVTLSEKGGSDADQAALTIALLRASGVHARFVRGTVELSADAAANWLGVNTAAGEQAAAAPDILASGGVPTTALKVNGQLNAVRFDHVWLEAHVSGDAYRGVDEQAGEKRWLPLDPSIKPNDLKAPEVDLTEVLEPAAAQWLTAFGEASTGGANLSFTPPTPAESNALTTDLIAEARTAVDAAGNADELDDLIGSREIRETSAAYLPSSLPFRTKAVAAEWRAIPSSLSSEVEISVEGANALHMPAELEEAEGTLRFSAKTHDLAEKRITLAYVPASVTDAEVIDAYHGMLNAPAYAAQLTPVLRVDGQVVARGSAPVPVGYAQRFTVRYRSPGFMSDEVNNPVLAGSLSALTIAVGPTSATSLKARSSVLAPKRHTTTMENLLTDERVGELLSELGGYYFLRNDTFNAFASQAVGVSSTRALSGAITAADLAVTYVAGFPVRAKLAGLSVDVDQDVQAVVAKKPTEDLNRRYLRSSATYASSSESHVLNRVFNVPWAVSTVSVFKTAAQQRVPIVEINATNVAQIDTLLDVTPSVRADVRKALADGAQRVVIPQRRIKIDVWTGSGYVADYGDAYDYRISGGTSGGLLNTVWDPLGFGGDLTVEFYVSLFEAVIPAPLGTAGAFSSVEGTFDAYINSVAPFVKESTGCYADWSSFGRGYRLKEAVANTLVGIFVAGNHPLSQSGFPPSFTATTLASIGLVVASASVYGTEAALVALECE